LYTKNLLTLPPLGNSRVCPPFPVPRVSFPGQVHGSHEETAVSDVANVPGQSRWRQRCLQLLRGAEVPSVNCDSVTVHGFRVSSQWIETETRSRFAFRSIRRGRRL